MLIKSVASYDTIGPFVTAKMQAAIIAARRELGFPGEKFGGTS